MFFGPVPLSDALGAILAHSFDLPQGRLRKGRVLSESDLAALAATGLQQVVVAIPGAQDMGEDPAALRIAQAAAGPGVDCRVVGTGRVNLHAQTAGLVRLQVAAIHAANAIEPMLTLATLPPWRRVAAGEMVATVKVISYAVAARAVQQVAETLAGAVGLAAPVFRSASLIETQVPGQAAGEKGVRVTAARLARLGITMEPVQRCAHDTPALAAAIATDQGSGPLLILTGSATSDPGDVGPAALRAAGGQVTRVGMPVDPGNLLYLGALGGRVVLGLPGCAKSPALNGADWVLERICCGIPVTGQDIAAMGVGGLLVEPPSRPHSRLRNTPPSGA